jgi:hypothetical protein
LGIPLPIGEQDKLEEVLIGSVEELYNEMKNRSLVFKKILLKGLKSETWRGKL